MTSAAWLAKMSTAVSTNNGKDFLPWIFFFLCIATRVPFTSRLLLNMDSCQFALALGKFDITVHQPHPPGYFLYIMLGRLLNVFIADANTVYVSISVFFSGVAIVAAYLLGREIFERKIGIAAALIALSSPSFWFHGEVALSYIVEAFFSTVTALFCWRILTGREKYLWISVVFLGLAGGIRQNTPVFLLPMWLYSVRNIPPRKILASLGLLATTCLFWFIPMVWMSDGWDAYRGAFRELWMFNTGGHSVLVGEWSSLRMFSLKMFLYLIYGLGVGLFPVALAVYSMARRGQWKSVDSTKAVFFSLWVLPIMMFYLFVFLSIQNPGYILIFLPALFLLASFSIFHIGNELGNRYGKKAWLPILTVVVVLNMAAFFLLKSPVSYRWIRTHDKNLSILLADIKTFDPGETAVFVNNLIYYSYRHFMVYLPEYRAYNVDVRTAKTGERRKTFWGVNRETFLEEDVTLPGSITWFVTPIDRDDSKYIEIKSYERAGINVREVTESMVVASGSVGLLEHIYPKLRVSFERRKSSS
jgi:MFS family permease